MALPFSDLLIGAGGAVARLRVATVNRCFWLASQNDTVVGMTHVVIRRDDPQKSLDCAADVFRFDVPARRLYQQGKP